MATTRFYFTTEQPEQQFIADVQSVNDFNEQQLSQCVTITLMFLRSETAQEAPAALEAFAEEQGVNSKKLNNTVRAILYFFSEALKQHMTAAHVEEDLTKLGLEASKASLLAKKWQTNFVSLSSSMITKTLTVNKLLDMQWKFGVTTASDELDKVGSCFLQLRLLLDKGGQKENVVMEMSLPQFYQFLHEMQKANRQVQ